MKKIKNIFNKEGNNDNDLCFHKALLYDLRKRIIIIEGEIKQIKKNKE